MSRIDRGIRFGIDQASRPILPPRGDIFSARKRVLPASKDNPAQRGVTLPIVGSEGQQESGRTTSESFLRVREIYIDILAGLRRQRGREHAYEDPVISESDIAGMAEIDEAVLRNFRLGLSQTLDPNLILKGVKGFIPREDSRLEELREIAEETKEILSEEERENMLLRIFTQNGISIRKAIKGLRLSQGLTQKDFAKRSGTNLTTLRETEEGLKSLFLSTINSLIDGSGLDQKGKVAQLLRLIAVGKEAMSLKRLHECSYGELEAYLGIIIGVPAMQLAKELDQPYSTIRDRGQDGMKRRRDTKVNEFIDLLGLPPTDPLAKVLLYKAQYLDGPMSFDMIQGIKNGQYLFAEYLEGVQVPLSVADEQLRQTLQQFPTVGSRVRFLQEQYHKISLAEFEEITGIKMGNISSVKTSKLIPEDRTLVRLLGPFGYGLDHPIIWDFFELVDKERQEKELTKYRRTRRGAKNSSDTA